MADSPPASSPVRPSSAGYQVFMLGLCLYALVMLLVQTTAPLSPETRAVLDYADFVVCGLFLVDFLISFYRAESRWSYLVKWGWLDLLSSIPTVDVVRWGRLGRVIRVFRALRALRATRLIARMVLERRAENTILAAALAALLLVVFCSIAVLYFENDPESGIKTAEQAIWWSFATITTVGYGDFYPVTTEGRVIAAILMCAGVGLFGTFSAFLASWFIATDQEVEAEKDQTEEIAALRREVIALREALEMRRL
jgi:voltage-gated potassium channel